MGPVLGITIVEAQGPSGIPVIPSRWDRKSANILCSIVVVKLLSLIRMGLTPSPPQAPPHIHAHRMLADWSGAALHVEKKFSLGRSTKNVWRLPGAIVAVPQVTGICARANARRFGWCSLVCSGLRDGSRAHAIAFSDASLAALEDGHLAVGAQ